MRVLSCLSGEYMTQTALIQGGGGALGQALINQVVHSGLYEKVFVTARDVSRISLIDPCIIPIKLDLQSDYSIKAAAREIALKAKALNLVITTAGILQDESLGLRPEKKLGDLSRVNLEIVFSINCFGPFLWYAALDKLIRHRETLVIATLSARVGSIGDNRLGGWHSYRASKTAQNMLTKNLSLELRRTNPGAIVVGLHPGTVDTNLSKPFQSAVPIDQLFNPDQSAGYLWSIISELSPERSGQIIAWDGQEIDP